MTHTREARDRASEIKFLVGPEAGDRIRAWARANLERDPHGSGPAGDEYSVSSLYFDTVRRDVLNRRGSFGRAKYRIRRYDASDTVFLERKLRKPGMLIKRRTEIAAGDLAWLGEDAPGGEWDGGWFEKRVAARRLRPVCQLSYHRMARGIMTANGLARLTLDDALVARRVEHARFEPYDLMHQTNVLPGQLILELKFRREVPAAFRRLVAELRLAPQAASKYRFAMTVVADPAMVASRLPWEGSTASAAAFV